MRSGLVLLTLATMLASTAWADSKPGKTGAAARREVPPLNTRVLTFARKQIGRAVGDGECTTLAVEALKEAGARRFPWVPTGDYVWGREVASFREALPGDIVQFRDAVFAGRRPLSGMRWQTWRYEYPHHTAIVAEVREAGNVVVLLHQNVGTARARADAKRVVQQGLIRPTSLQPGGRVWIYRPVDRDDEETRTEPELPDAGNRPPPESKPSQSTPSSPDRTGE
ncbi:MAG: hypothetical protein U0794_19240 [Isosphaeraceae bacterium]